VVKEKSIIISESKRLSFTRSLTFKTLIPMGIIIFLIIVIFGIYLSTTAKNNSKKFLIENMLIPEFEWLVKEKDNDFVTIEKLTEFTAQKIEDKIQDSKGRTSNEVDELFGRYISKKPDGSYRSSLDESKGRYQMAAFINNKVELDARHKSIFVDAFLFFEPFAESSLPFVFTTYFASNNSIWQYGFPDWALNSSADEYFDKYGWFYEADPVHNPAKGHTWTDMYYDELQGQWEISSLMPIYDGEEFLGIVGQDFILQKITEVTKRIDVRGTGILFFVDNLGNIVAHPDTEYLISEKVKNDEKLNLKTLLDEPLTKILQILQTNEQRYMFTEESNRRIVIYYPLESINWKMVYVVNESELLRIVEQTNNYYILSFIVFATLIIILIILLVKISVTDPIKKLTEATNDISKDNLDKKIDIQSKDEIGELADSFNQMTMNLKKSRKKIEGYSKDLEKKVGERTKELNKKVIELTKTKTAMLNMMEDLDETNKELTEYQKELKSSLRELKKLDIEKDEFIAISAHELKTPMASILGFSQLLMDKKIEDTKTRNHYLKIIEEETKRLAQLVTDILDLSRIDLGTMKFTIEDTDIVRLADDVKSELYQRAKEKGLSLDLKLDGKIPQIKTDKEKVKQVIINLVDNAIKYTERGGIRIEINNGDDVIEFSVIDTGIGIPKKYFDKLFRRFYQVESHLTRKVGGSGLGLSICKEYIEELGGKIWFESEERKGSTFYFTLPSGSKK